jgi:L-ascorbate metabolism protein UlaG (beta-lactamase superfamily)
MARVGRFDDRATEQRGPLAILKWKVVDPLRGRGPPASRNDYRPPSRPYDRELVQGDRAQLTWLGHASFLVTLAGQRVLIDPVLATRLQGVIPRHGEPGIPVDALPPVDVVCVSHNHYDHLDTWTLKRLGARPTYVVPLGNEALVRAAGAQKIIALDWWEPTKVGNLMVTLTPARHWSMRYPWNRNDMLWGGFVLRGPEGAAYHSGDTAAFDFREIGRKLGPIDWAMLPIGAYEPQWFMQAQHMNPEEAVEAAVQVGAKNMVAMHWGTFKLTDEPLDEPPPRARQAWTERGLAPERLWILDVGESRRL